MEPEQKLAVERDDQTKLQTIDEKKNENETNEKIENASVEPVLLETLPPKEVSQENEIVKHQKTPEIPKLEIEERKEIEVEQISSVTNLTDVNSSTKPDEAESIVKNDNEEISTKKNVENANSSGESDTSMSHLPSFPGTVTKSVPGSNDVKIEIDSNSLLDRVILYSLKNTVVDNSRLDAAKNKYMLNNGNITSSFNSNSNGSDSNSSSKSVDKFIEEFKGGGSKSSSESSPIDPTTMELKSDISNESSNGAEKCVNFSNSSLVGIDNEEAVVRETLQNVIVPSPGSEHKSIDSPSNDVEKSSDIAKIESIIKLPESTPPKPNLENEALDFRDKTSPGAKSNDNFQETPEMLDLTVPHRDEKSVPPIKRNHALYVGLPDFSKQIFSAPSISRPNSTGVNQQTKTASLIGPPKIKNPDFAAATRGAQELQMRHPDFSKSFNKTEQPSPAVVAVTPSNFPEIVRKNNYISDLQLKPPSSTVSIHSPAPPSSSPSYKIDYRTTAAISQTLLHEPKTEQPSTSQTVYPNMKKEGINAYNQQLIIEEPMAHIIHKNQFLPHANEPPRVGGWAEKNEQRLLGGSSALQINERFKSTSELENKPQIPLASHQYHNSNEDLRKTHPAYYPPSFNEREFNNNSQENLQLSHEFSLKQKEQQLRQEGTIITVKNEPMRTPTKEITERRSADLFRDYKLKQPKESPDSARRVVEQSPVSYQQSYPDFPSSYPKYSQQQKVETIVKSSHHSPAPPLAYSQERQSKQVPSSSRNYHSPSPVSYHNQPKSPLTVPSGPSLMNPPQNWPPPLVQPLRRDTSSTTGPPNKLSPSPTNFQHASSSQSSHMNYGYPYPIPGAPSGPQAVKVSQNFPPYGPSRNVEIKEIPNRHYQPPTSSSSAQNYYHQQFPDFSRRFDPDKKPLNSHDPNANYPPPGFVPIDPRQLPPEMNFQRFPPHHELEIRSSRDHQQQYRSDAGHSYYPSREVGGIQDYPRLQEPVMRHPDLPMRLNEELYDRSRGVQPMKVERRMDEPPKILAGPSSLPLRRPEPTEVTVIAKVKIEQTPAPTRNVPSTSTSIKSAKSIFAEVKRESPLDLSVKTVKTKADSTGCDQDMSLRQRAEPSGLKVEFTPNFAKVTKTDCRQQARLGPQDYPVGRSSHSILERKSEPQKYSSEAEKNRSPPSAAPPSIHHQQQMPHTSNNRNYFHEHRYQPIKDMERPHAPAPVLPNSSQYPEHSGYSSEGKHNNVMEPQRPGPSNESQSFPHREIPRPEDKNRMESRRGNSYYLPPHQASAAASTPYSVSNKTNNHAASSTELSRPTNHVPTHASNPRDPLYYERERDRKYVAEILNRQNRKESMPTHPDMRQFQPIGGPPRKRIIEQHHTNSVVPPKQGKIEEPPRLPPDSRHSAAAAMMSHHHLSSQHYSPYEQRFQRSEAHSKSAPIIGQPPALVKNDIYQKPIAQQSSETNHYPDSRREVVVNPTTIPVNHPPYPNSNYYPNPKAEMIHRSDPSNNHKQERFQFPNQNFQQRPDDNTLQLYPRIHHPIQESGIKNEHQQAGPFPGTSGESARLINGMIPSSISGSNGNIARGADQSTILKLKTNLELKEQKKLIINKSELGDDFDQQSKKDLSPRQFRTKGELKGFIPLPTNFDAKPVPTSSPGLATGPSAFDLLDWGSACNDFVQQLETGKKKTKRKRSINTMKSGEGKTDDKPSCEIPGTTTNNLSEIPKEILKSINKSQKNSSSDEDKPLLELVNPLNNSTNPKKQHDSIVEKLSRNIREKQRLELEQKIAARLGKPSSSESETEARRPVRTAKRVRRLRKRAALGIRKTDEEPSVEEEENEEELNHKRRSSKSVSKLDDVTSSEDEKKKKLSREEMSIDGKKAEHKATKAAAKAVSSKQDSKKQETSTETSDSDETTNNKITKLSTAKNVKKLKDLGDGSSIKNLLEEEETMTRSKRKLEIEKKLSDGKILRNEKIVRNVAPDKKAKTETNTTTIKKTTPKRKDSTKLDETKRKNNDSDSEDSKSKKKLRRISKAESSSSSEESQAEEVNKAER